MAQLFNFKPLGFLVVIFFFANSGFSQCFNGNTVFGDGEQIRYTVSYNWGPVWVDAGLVTFVTKKEDFQGKTVWHLKGTGKTFASYDFLFKVRDYFDSWTEQDSFKPLSFRRYVYEGGYTLLNTLNFDYHQGKVLANTKSNDNPPRLDTLPVQQCAFDMLSAVYYTRTLDFSNTQPGFKQNVKVVLDDAYFDIYIRILGKEIVESTDGKRYHCIKFAAKMVQGTIFKGDEDVVVWVTDDANKIPVYIEAKIIIGTIKAYLKDTKGLKNPVTSIVQ